MNSLISDLINNKNTENSLIKVAELLKQNDCTTEECFTYESLCRIQKNKEHLDLYKSKIIDTNRKYCTNSYDLYYMLNSPIDHEFPIEIENKQEADIIKTLDRYLGILHLLIVFDNKDSVEPILKFRANIIKKLKNISNAELVQHISAVMKSEENKAGLADTLNDKSP